MVMPFHNAAQLAQPIRPSAAPLEWSRSRARRGCVKEPPLWMMTEVERKVSSPRFRGPVPMQCERRYAPPYVPPCIPLATPRPLPFGILSAKEMGMRATKLNDFLSPRFSAALERLEAREIGPPRPPTRKPDKYAADDELHEHLASVVQKGKISPRMRRPVEAYGLPRSTTPRLPSLGGSSGSTPSGSTLSSASASPSGPATEMSASDPDHDHRLAWAESLPAMGSALPLPAESLAQTEPRNSRRALRRSRSF